ncbi:MAG: hypothetical protein JST92_02410, partial [Deltaproteobacteria bacterium]|nr:hypothetical protein [Deltaproteobacteria bacterium]
MFTTRKLLFIIAGALTLGAALRLAWALAPSLAGVDFYAYVCFARDLISPRGASAARFAYFPGVYVFWAAVMKLWGQSLRDLQQGYVTLLFTNAALCALLVFRALGRSSKGPLTPQARVLAGAFAFAWCLLLDVPLEGFVGATEPIATLPFLLGLLAWGGAPLTGRAGSWRALALGLGIGLGVFGKQQALLVAFGWLALVPDVLGPKPLHARSTLLLIPIAAVGTLLSALQLSGGLSALVRGVQT